MGIVLIVLNPVNSNLKNKGVLTMSNNNDALGRLVGLVRSVRPIKLVVGFSAEMFGTLYNNGQNWLTAFRRFLHKENPREALAPAFNCDKTKDGWKLMRDIPFSGGFVPDIKEFLRFGKSTVNGAIMKKMAKRFDANLGQHHAEYLLEHQERIPKEWRGYCLIFPGTVWLGNRGGYGVPCLGWRGGKWCLGFGWLRAGWGGNGRLVCFRE